jgi:hypothetical protein
MSNLHNNVSFKAADSKLVEISGPHGDATVMKTAVFWDVAPCSLVDIDLHIDAGGSKLL